MQKINTSDGLFKNYNKINLTAGTVITAEWLNAVQQELTNAIEAFGVSLDSTRSDQLKDIIIGILDGKLDINNVSAIFPNMTGQSGKFLATDGVNRFWTVPTVSHLDLINKGDNTHAQIDQHIASRSNPHNITKEQLDLENVINVKQQPESLTLTALSLTAAEEDKVPYYDGINSAKTTTLTSFARAILDDVSAEEVRATLGLGSSATKASTEFEPSGSIQAHVQAYNHEGMLPANQVAAAAGTYGTPSDTNRYVTDDDPRLEGVGGGITEEHAFTHATTGTDAITPEMIGAEQSGTAQSTINTHESTYNHILIHSNTNDPSSDEKAALAGTSGTPSTTNKYVTNSDSRLSDARTPLSHNHNTLYEPINANIQNHISSTSNPHSVTKAQVGLTNVTDVQQQPINANLTAISELSSEADKLPYFTGEATAALATLTTFARTLLDDADAATACSTLGIGSIATQASNNVSITGGSISGLTSLSSSVITSTVATGTSPFTVTSSTLVTNLNADTVDGFHASQTPAANQIPVLNSAGRLVLGGTDDGISKAQVGGPLAVRSGNNSLVVGADTLATTLTDSTIKQGRISAPHYLTNEEPVTLAFVNCGNASNALYIGGGSSILNAATDIILYTAENYNTTTGTPRVRVLPSGRILVGSTLPTDNGVSTVLVNGIITSSLGSSSKGINIDGVTALPAITLTSADSGQVHINMGGATFPGIGGISYSDNAKTLWFRTNSTNRLLITRDGRTLIGPTLPTDDGVNALQVNGTIKTSDTISVQKDGVNHYRNVAHYSSVETTLTGTMKITLPKSWTNTMMVLKITGYNFHSENPKNYWEAIISGYNYKTTPEWVRVSAEIRGWAPFSEVRLAHDGTNCCVLLGNASTVWYIPKFAVTDFIVGQSALTGWESGWTIAPITDETGINYVNSLSCNTHIRNSLIVGDSTWDGVSQLQVNGPVAAKGLKLDGTASSNVNTLDYYQEGTFTPVLYGLTTAGEGTYTVQTGKYTRIGNTVNITIHLTWTAHTGTGDMRISGLPFASAGYASLSSWHSNLFVGSGKVLGTYASDGSGQVILMAMDPTGAASSQIPMDTTGTLLISGTYFV